MSFDYTSIQGSASSLISKFGVAWTVSRAGIVQGKLYGVRTVNENSYKKTGLVLASDKNVELLMTNVVPLKPGDSLTNGTETYVVSVVAPLKPGDKVLIQKVTAS